MNLGEAFAFDGDYRAQSKSHASDARLSGHWIVPGPGDANSDLVNQAVRSHLLWCFAEDVALRPALVARRHGAFAAEPDILYKRSHFSPRAGSPAMPVDIVDIAKARSTWQGRRPFMAALFGSRSFGEMERLVGDVSTAAANEYFSHEGGHRLGIGTARKYAQGYFRPGGATCWPLVYVEEFRADMLSFGIAADVLDQERAVAVFLYNLLVRFAGHVEAVVGDSNPPHGSIPFMLFWLLTRQGLLACDLQAGELRLVACHLEDLVRGMRACSEFVAEALVTPELLSEHPTDAAQEHARFHQRVFGDDSAMAAFSSICRAAAGKALADASAEARPEALQGGQM